MAAYSRRAFLPSPRNAAENLNTQLEHTRSCPDIQTMRPDAGTEGAWGSDANFPSRRPPDSQHPKEELLERRRAGEGEIRPCSPHQVHGRCVEPEGREQGRDKEHPVFTGHGKGSGDGQGERVSILKHKRKTHRKNSKVGKASTGRKGRSQHGQRKRREKEWAEAVLEGMATKILLN